MKLILGLGNPGAAYAGTRHNMGFWVCDELTAREGTSFALKSKFQADVAEFTHDGQKIIVAKPHTFYNDAGMSYLALRDFYKIAPEDTLIIHDELALPFGTIRIRQGSSDAGNNGIKSLVAHGGQSSWRLRIGIANDQRRTGDDAHFVLSHFTADEQRQREQFLSQILSYVTDFMNSQLQPHSETLAPKPDTEL